MEKNKTEEEVRTKFLGSNNVMIPLRERVKQRLLELKSDGKVSFHTDENRDWHNIEPKTPICGPINWGDCVRRVSEEHFTVTYKLFAVKDGKIVVVNVFAGDPQNGRLHKVIKSRVIEHFKKGIPFTKKSEKMEDADLMTKDYADKIKNWKAKRKEMIE